MTFDLPVPYPTFVRALAKPGSTLLPVWTPIDADLLHMALGLSGEAAELMEPIRGYCHGIGSFAQYQANLLEEMGDMEFYLEHLRDVLHLSRVVPEETDYTRALPRTTPHIQRVMDSGVQVVVGVGQVVDAIKRITVYRKVSTPFTDALDKFSPGLVVGLGNIECGLADLRHRFTLSRDEVLLANESKLMVRYSGMKFTDDAALTRADKVEG